MDAEPRPSDLSRPAGWRLPRPSAWLAQWRLRGVLREIARLEAALAQEHGLAETAPLQRHLAQLLQRRDALLARLHGRTPQP